MANAQQQVFVYADESGHSGKHIFQRPPVYFQGAVISAGEIDSVVGPVLDCYKAKYKVERLHGNELGFGRIDPVCRDISNELAAVDWAFHLTVIDKPYIATTKYVDTVFDPYENPTVPEMWYWVDFFRHLICLAVDDVFPERLKVRFWGSFLTDDTSVLREVSAELFDLINRGLDGRLLEVVLQGIAFARDNPGAFTFVTGKGKKAYREQTPNIVAFGGMLMAVHRFCRARGLSVGTLVHDRSSEFSGAMRELHMRFYDQEMHQDTFGGIPRVRDVDHDLGQFHILSSDSSSGLQIADLFLWSAQRSAELIPWPAWLDNLLSAADTFEISPRMSRQVVACARAGSLSQTITPEMEADGKRLLRMMEARRLERMEEFRKREDT